MSYFKTIKTFLSQLKKPEPVSDSTWEGPIKRLFHRHHVRSFPGFLIKIEGISYPLINVSYGGTCIESRENFFSLAYLEKNALPAQLSILDHEIECTVNVSYVQDSMIGFNLVETDELRKYLDGILYFMDGGFRMKTLPKSQVNAYFQSPSWSSYNSLEGVLEAHTKMDMNGQLEEVNISQINGIFREYTVFSKAAIQVSTLPKKSLRVLEKKEILRNSIFVLIGFRQIGKTEIFNQVIHAGINLLHKEVKEPS